MKDLLAKLKEIILMLLHSGDQKTAAHLVEELHVEHPHFFHLVTDTYNKKYDLAGCGAQMSPSTVVLQTLYELHQDGAITKTQSNGTSYWHKCVQK